MNETDQLERMAANTPSADKLQAQALGALIRGALSVKALIWVSMLASVGLWTAAVAHPEPWRLLAALGATITMYLPTLFKK
jgi:hypothetical protein